MALVAVSLGQTSCTRATTYIDPLAVDGRDGSSTANYPTLMRIGMAARNGGDYANAIGVFRRAAQVAPSEAVPLVAIGDILREIGKPDEAIVAYNDALDRNAHYPLALEGLAKAYLGTGKPGLAEAPLDTAFQDAPTNPKILMLMGVTADFSNNHPQAQADYREGLKYAPDDPALSLDLALSLALSEEYDNGIAILSPIASGPDATARERQTLALIFGLKGDRAAAERLARMDLDPAAVQHNLAYYETLRRLTPEARSRAVLSANGGSKPANRS